MAFTDIVMSGKLFKDNGDPVEGATVNLFHTGTTSGAEATYSGGTTAAGLWTFTETSLDATYDVQIDASGSIRYILWSDEIALKGVDTASLKVRGVDGAAAPIYLFADRGDDAGDGWRINVTDHTTGTFAIGSNKASATAIVDYLTITNGANAAASVVALGGDLTVGDDLSLTSDSAVFNMGAGNDFTITHDGTTGATIAGTPIAVNSTGALTLDSSTDITLDAGGADIFLKDDGTLFGTLTNNSGELLIKSSSSGTTAATFTGAHVVFAGTVDATTDFTVGTTVITDDQIVMTPSPSDTVTIAGATHGILNVTTVDAAGTAADVNIDADGEIVIDAADAAGTIFKIAGTAQLSVIDGAIRPTTDNDIDLGSGSYQFKDAYINGTANLDAVDIDGNVQLDGTFTAGATTDGYDVKFWGNTSNTYMLWDESTDDLVLTLGAELYFYDAAGGEHIKSDGTDMTIYAGTDLNLTAGTDINIPASVGLTFGDDGEKIEGDGTNLVVASSGTLDMNSGGVLTLDSGAAINIEPAGGSAILLDGTISVDAGVVTGATSLTIGDTVITDGLITDSTGLKFTADIHFGTTNTNQDVNFYGVNTDRDMSWDAGNNALLIKDNAALYLGDGTDLQIYHGSDVSHIRGVNYPLQVNLNGGDLSNIGDMEIDASKTITGSGDLTIDTVGNLLLDGGNDTVLMNSGATICIVDDVGLRLSADTAHADTAGTNIISLFNGTAPAGTLSNGASFFCASGEMKVIDAAGNVTVLSPHDDDGEWVFHSHDNSGKVIHIQMERMMKRLDEMLGGGFIEEYIED
jgi:hypothetical protein